MDEWMNERIVNDFISICLHLSIYTGDKFHTNQGKTIQADLAFVCTGRLIYLHGSTKNVLKYRFSSIGIKPNSSLFATSSLSHCLDERGFVKANQYLQLETLPHIFVAG